MYIGPGQDLVELGATKLGKSGHSGIVITNGTAGVGSSGTMGVSSLVVGC